MQLFDGTKIDFMGHRRGALIVSTVLVLISIGSLAVRGLNYGIEFTGGVVIEANYTKDADLTAIRTNLEEEGFEKVQVQNLGSPTDVMIRLPPPKEGADLGALREHVIETLRKQADNVEIRRFDTTGPQVGSDMAQASILAVVFASIGIFLYVSIRFRWKLAAGAIVAELHDVITTIGLFSLVGWQFDLSVLGAVLAVLGHSLNDKIVLYDRIRENFRLVRRGSAESIVNTSVNQVLSRTIVTSGSTMLVVIALALLGGETLFGFSVALIFGIGVGVYSSIYVASAMALLLKVTPTDLVVVKTAPEDSMP
ncbi:MAG TPA: protein translocase subunit SecF [Gammaproteobacteria bacterium]|nr:protein translocase subunit SecF [Gammaproteobacteria bacterium]